MLFASIRHTTERRFPRCIYTGNGSRNRFIRMKGFWNVVINLLGMSFPYKKRRRREYILENMKNMTEFLRGEKKRKLSEKCENIFRDLFPESGTESFLPIKLLRMPPFRSSEWKKNWHVETVARPIHRVEG